MMIELDIGCAHLIFPCGVLCGCVAVVSVDAYWTPCYINMNVSCGVVDRNM
jgi:hypothetical protein